MELLSERSRSVHDLAAATCPKGSRTCPAPAGVGDARPEGCGANKRDKWCKSCATLLSLTADCATVAVPDASWEHAGMGMADDNMFVYDRSVATPEQFVAFWSERYRYP